MSLTSSSDSIVSRINKTYTVDDPALQESVVEEAMNYYLSIRESNDPINNNTNENKLIKDHLFCCSDSSSTIVSFLVVVLAGFAVDFNNEQFIPIRTCINNCTDCLLSYHRKRALIRKNFLLEKMVPYNQIQSTMEKPTIWEADNLYSQIEKSIDDKLENEELKKLLTRIFFECLLNPSILRYHDKLKIYFNHCLQFLDDSHDLLVSKGLKIYPGLVYLLFSDDENQRNWAISKLPYNKEDKIYYKDSDFDPLFIEEYEIHFFNIQKPDFFTDERSIQFWTNLIPLIRFSSVDTIRSTIMEPFSCASYRDDKRIRIVPLYQVFINHVFSYLKTPLPFLLRFLGVSLEKFKMQLFEFIKPHNYMSFFDMAFNNPTYKKYLQELPPETFPSSLSQLDTSRNPLFIDLVKWMEICSHILNDSSKCQFAIAMFGFLADFITDPNCGKFIGTYIMENMIQQLSLKNTVFQSDRLGVELSYKASARSLLDKKCIVLFDSINIKFLKSKAIKLIKTCLIYDIESYSYYSNKLNLNEPLLTPEFNNALWNLLQVKVTSNSNIALNVFSAFSNIINVYMIDIPYKKTKLISERKEESVVKGISFNCNRHNKIIESFATSVENVLNKLSEYITSTHMKSIINDNDASLGFWSLLLSPIDRIYSSAVALMSETFDVDDRLEAFKECLKLNIHLTLDAFKAQITKYTRLQLFLPTQRTVKILMDFMNALFNPMNGIIVSSKIELTLDLKTSIVEFWIDVWGFLGMIFKNIFDWSITYERLKVTLAKEISDKITSDLLNFTRDVLDLSHLVLNGMKIIVSLLETQNYTSTDIKLIKETLLKPIVVTLGNLFKWLRLSDSALLISCVDLITKILDLSCEVSMQLSEELLTVLVKLCLRAKKFNNKMNIEQTGELLLRARAIDSKLVENVSFAVEEEKKSKSQPPPTDTKSELQYTSRKQQNTLSGFLKPYVRENVPSFNPPKRMSKLEIAQAKLAEKRKMEAKEPAPARPSGFNIKKKIVNISDSESDHDSDNETQDGNLFTKEQVVAKMKKTKAALQSLQAPRFNSSNTQSMKQIELMQKKKQEELMRLRLNVDTTPLYKTILSWSYNNDKELPSDYDESKYKPITDKFESVKDYRKTFEPLLLLECWQSIQRAKQVGSEIPFRLTIGSRSATDSFFDIYTSVKKEVVNETRCFGDNDLIVLMMVDNLPPEEDNRGIPRKLVEKCTVNCFAKVKEIKNTNGPYADVVLRVSSDNKVVHKISPSMELVGLKVNTMTTLEREFSSLYGLQYYDLSNEIIQAVPDPVETPDEKKINKLKDVYDVNDSQAKAISGTVQGQGFSLIQGPPGTGKTKTILGVIGYFLTQEDKNVHRVLAPGVKANISTSKASTGSVDNKRKILICAPSNAAVDELVLRIRNGIKNSKGETFKPNVVRLGKSDAINEQVKDLTLEEQVDAQLSKIKNNDDSSIRAEHRACIVERDELRKKLESNSLTETEISKAEMRLQEVLTKRRELGKRLDEMREQRAVNYRNREIERRNIQFKILNNAQVVCSTLSGSAHDVLAGMSLTFETVVIDEAAQCIELSAIIPLRYGCKKCIMVGDPNQLPPTVLSQKAASFKYEQSLFVRMQNNHKDSVYLLDVQYRMHPEISAFPSREFYTSKLKDGPNMKLLTERPWHEIEEYGPYRFFNLRGRQNINDKTKSLYNTTECKVILEIIESLYRKFPNIDWSNKIGVISPYKEQVRLLKKTFVDKYGFLITKQIDFNTVDGFQGQEKDIIIFSCVRAENNTGVGFLADIRRMNVALTRARSSLWIVGSVDALVSNKTWRDLFEDANKRNLVTQAYVGFTKNIRIGEGNANSSQTPNTQNITRAGANKKTISHHDNAKKRTISDDGKKIGHSDNPDFSKMRKISKTSNPLPVKKYSGQISANKMTKISQPKSSGVILPRAPNGAPSGLVKISDKKKYPTKPSGRK